MRDLHQPQLKQLPMWCKLKLMLTYLVYISGFKESTFWTTVGNSYPIEYSPPLFLTWALPTCSPLSFCPTLPSPPLFHHPSGAEPAPSGGPSCMAILPSSFSCISHATSELQLWGFTFFGDLGFSLPLPRGHPERLFAALWWGSFQKEGPSSSWFTHPITSSVIKQLFIAYHHVSGKWTAVRVRDGIFPIYSDLHCSSSKC